MDKLVISNSEINTFKRCKREWATKYVRKLVPVKTKVVGAAPLGTLVHNVLAEYYHPGKLPSFDPIHCLDSFVNTDVRNNPEQETEIRKQADYASAMLEGYFEWVEETGVDAGLEVVSAEQKVQVEMPNFILQAKLDILVRRQSDGALQVLDHKTTTSFDQVLQWLPLNEQARTYDLLYMLKFPGERIDGALWNLIKVSKRTARAQPPFYHREEVRFNVKEMRHFYNRLVAVVDDMLALRAKLTPENSDYLAYPSPSKDCKWRCEYFSICRNLDTDYEAGGLTSTLFKVGDPYSYYETESEDNG